MAKTDTFLAGQHHDRVAKGTALGGEAQMPLRVSQAIGRAEADMNALTDVHVTLAVRANHLHAERTGDSRDSALRLGPLLACLGKAGR
ncbi:hypothetical protein D9M71_228640 [compost metagenome]